LFGFFRLTVYRRRRHQLRNLSLDLDSLIVYITLPLVHGLACNFRRYSIRTLRGGRSSF